MYRFVTLLTKVVFTQTGRVSTVRETRNISAQVVSLPLVFYKVWLSLLLLDFTLGLQQGFSCVEDSFHPSP